MFRFESSLYFANTEHFKNTLYEITNLCPTDKSTMELQYDLRNRIVTSGVINEHVYININLLIVVFALKFDPVLLSIRPEFRIPAAQQHGYIKRFIFWSRRCWNCYKR